MEMEMEIPGASISAYLVFLCMLPALLVTTLLWRTWRVHVRQARRCTPPGPRGLPVIGHLHLLGKVPHQSLYELSKKYGPLMSLRFGTRPVLVASTPAMAKQLLQTHDLTFSGRPSTVASRHLTYHGSNISFAQPDRAWRLKRQLCATQLFTSKCLEAFKWMREREVDVLLRSFLVASRTSPGQPIAVRPKLVDATNNTICTMLFSKRLSELPKGDGGESLLSLLNQTVEVLGEFNISDYVPIVAWMDLQGCGRRSKILSEKMRGVWKAIFEERRRVDEVDDAKDLLQVLLRNPALSEEDLMGTLQDLFAGGTDTIAYTVEWALAELLCNPEKLKRAQEEIDIVVGRRCRVQEEDITKLPYLQAIVKETLRLHPVVPLLIPHVANSTCKIEEFQITSGTQAFVNVWAIGRDPNWWESPLDFMPERFWHNSTNSVDARGLHFQYVPFGSGRRTCPGLSLGLISVQTMLASLLHSFEWTTTFKPNMLEVFHILSMMDPPLVAFPTPRLPLDCYL